MKSKKIQKCPPEEVALKGLFLGPEAENRHWVRSQIIHLLEAWFRWRAEYRPEDGAAISHTDQLTQSYRTRRKLTENALNQLAERFESEIPKFSPRYIGHMTSEISLPALFGHILTLLHNPNNISSESSKVGVLVEEEAISELGKMFGFKRGTGVGHFTSGGTIANFEAIYRARARNQNWMSAGLAAHAKGAKVNLFAKAAMGWEHYRKLMSQEKLKEKILEFQLLESNPYEVAKKK